jgi:hypothetical protein
MSGRSCSTARNVFFARPVELAQEPTHRGATDGDLSGDVQAGAQFFEGGIGLGLYQSPNHLEPGWMEFGRVATPVGFGSDAACGPMAGDEIAHKTQAHGKACRQLAH